MELDKLLRKHIKNKNFVKVYISIEGYTLTHVEGFIFEQNKDFVLMNDMRDFDYDGFVVLRKSDINEIKYTGNEKFFLHILIKENIKKKIFQQQKQLDFHLDTLQKMMKQIKKLKIPVICEHLYKKDDLFQIGTIKKVSKKRAKMRYFNARGKFDFNLLSVEYKTLTLIRIGSPYINLFYKYSK